MKSKKEEYIRDMNMKGLLQNNGKKIQEEEEEEEEENFLNPKKEIVPPSIYEDVNLDWSKTEIKRKFVDFLELKLEALSQIPEIVRYKFH